MPLAKPNRMVRLGDVVAAAYEQAESVTQEPERAARLATAAVLRLLVDTGNLRAARRLAGRKASGGRR